MSARQAWSWGLGGAAIALAVSTAAANYGHQYIWGGIVQARRSFTEATLLVESLQVTMRGIWIAAFAAVLLGGAAYFVAPRASRARWLALLSFLLACLALWMQYEYRERLRWS